ncbi:MAG: Uma2 family endonuclease [Bryobacterales bacterium]|nr:Uma2 family endonuclease [Bryobacterales bacterium]
MPLLPLDAPVKLSLRPDQKLDADAFYDFCVANPDIRMELTAEGEIIVMPPAGMESDHQSLQAGSKLQQYADRDGRGVASGSSAGFTLPSGAVRSPDAAWTSKVRLRAVAYSQRRRFPRVVPEFVVEVMSPSDTLTEAQAKMQEWMAAGVELGWLIDGDARTVVIYRAGQEPETRTGIEEIAGEGPVAGFVLQLESLWAGLEDTTE